MNTDMVAEFGRAAELFRSEIEGADEAEPGASYARRLRNALARVYLAAVLLGRPAFVDGEDAPGVDVTQSSHLEQAVRARLGPADTFLDVWDPTEPIAGDPIQRTLAGELVEIYGDLGVALSLLAEERPGALWDIAEAFEGHWGKHAVDVLRPLHHLAHLGVQGIDY
jgi:Domain of unknown function (DUF5063)